MKTVENNRFVTTVGNFQSAEFVVQRHNMRHLMSILRDQLYSDKKLAPIREYSCNAYDANVENGKRDVPIKVTLPTTLFPEFKIRDYGKGLIYEDMVNIFCSYGESTKRNSNDFIGQLGIGSKSGFAYGDNFLVTSFIDNKKITYNCVLDQSGVGSLIHLTTEDSAEPSGLEVTIPIRQQDIVDFKNKSLSFFKFWEVYPEIVGTSAYDIENSRKKGDVILSGDGWEIYANDGLNMRIAHVVMGNISYPINWDLIYDYSSRYNDPKLRPFYEFITNSNVLLRMKIGEIEMAPSREALQYTEHTVKSIRAKLDNVIKTMSSSINQTISTAPNLWEARMLYGKIFGYLTALNNNTNMYRQLERCFTDIVWGPNKVKIENYAFTNLNRFDAIKGLCVTERDVLDKLVHSFEFTARGVLRHHMNGYTNSSIACNPKNLIVVNDIIDKNINKNAIRWFLDQNKTTYNTLYMLNFKTDKAREDWYKTLSFETVPVTKFSDIVAKYVANKPKVVRQKVADEFTKIGYFQMHNYVGADMIKYMAVELDKTKGYYVYVEDRMVTVNNRKIPLNQFVERLKVINSELKLNIDTIYFVGPRIKTHKKFSDKNFTNVVDILKNALSTHNSIGNWIEMNAFNNSVILSKTKNNALILGKGIMTRLATQITDANGLFHTILKSYPDINFKQNSNIVAAIRYINMFEDDSYNKNVAANTEKYNKMWEQLYAKYGMMRYINADLVDNEQVKNINSTLVTELVNYINLADKK